MVVIFSWLMAQSYGLFEGFARFELGSVQLRNGDSVVGARIVTRSWIPMAN